MARTKDKPLLFAHELTLDEWLATVLTPEKERKCRIQDYSFPSDEHLASR